MSKLFYRHGRLMHGLERGVDYYGWVHMNRQGFRRALDVSLTPADSVYRIITVGSSTTFDGNTSGDSSTWTARLEQTLNAGGGRRYEVLNAGVPGFEIFDDLVRLELELSRFKPNLIILYEGHNDLFNTLARAGARDESFDPRPFEVTPMAPWTLWLERHSLLYHKLGSRFQAVRQRASGQERLARATPADFAKVVDAGLETYARNLRAFLAVAQSQGITVVIPQLVYTAEADAEHGTNSTVHALWRNAIPFAPPEVVWSSYAKLDSVARAAAAEYHAAHIQAADSSLYWLDAYSIGDPIHFNDVGAWRMGRHLAAVVSRLPSVTGDIRFHSE